MGSLAVAFPADALAHAEVYAVAVKNRSVVRLRLQQDGAALRASSEELLLLGDGSDGPLEEASVQQPAEAEGCGECVSWSFHHEFHPFAPFLILLNDLFRSTLAP